MIKKLTSLILVLAFVIPLFGCARTGRTRRPRATLDNWIGYDEESLVSSWGAPQNVYEMGNGKRVIEYFKEQNIQTGGYTYTTPQTTYTQGMIRNTRYNTRPIVYNGKSTQYVTQTTPVQNISYWCKTSFILGNDGKIESWRYEGNNCSKRCKAPPNFQTTPTYQNQNPISVYDVNKSSSNEYIPWKERVKNPVNRPTGERDKP